MQHTLSLSLFALALTTACVIGPVPPDQLETTSSSTTDEPSSSTGTSSTGGAFTDSASETGASTSASTGADATGATLEPTTSAAVCDGELPGVGEPWGPCRDEDPLMPQWENRCDDGIFCTQLDGLGTICRPPCEFPEDDPAAGTCPCGSPGDSRCQTLVNPPRPDRPCDVPCAGGCPDGMACANPGDWCYWEGAGLGGGPAAQT